MSKTQKITFISILVAQGLVLHIFERMLPIPFIAPGAKLGLANIITVISLYTMGFKDSFTVIILRVLLSTLLGASISSLLYSITGGILSLITMFFIMKIGKDNVSIIGISIVGAFFHNVGQIIVASLILQNINLVLYFPILGVTGMITGFFVGITSNYLMTFLSKIPFYKVLKK